jgi:hypothetical protein
LVFMVWISWLTSRLLEKAILPFCPACGGVTATHTPKRDQKLHHYYRCHRSGDYRRNPCGQRMSRAEGAEATMSEFVSGVLKDPGRIRAGIAR